MLQYKISEEQEFKKITLDGPIDEYSGTILTELHSKISEVKKVIFNLEGISYVNSLGIRSWINFMRGFEEGRTIIFRKCAPDIIIQINMIPRFAGSARIESFWAHYICPECDHEQSQMFKTESGSEEILKQSSQILCEKCSKVTELEAEEDAFFEFLNAS
jgi:hypothetical protein